MKVLIIIPAYNEEGNLECVVSGLRQACPQFDYVVINDGSTDHTEQLCRRNHYPCISLPTNLGIAGAVRTGMKYAYRKGYDMVLQFDADGQHLPQYIERMVTCMERERCDVVIGSRYLGSEAMPKNARTLGSRMILAAIWLTTGNRLSDPTSGMRLYSRRIVRQFIRDDNSAPEPDTLSYLFRLGADIREVPVNMAERLAGQSYLTPGNAAKYMIHMLMAISVFQWFRNSKEAL